MVTWLPLQRIRPTATKAASELTGSMRVNAVEATVVGRSRLASASSTALASCDMLRGSRQQALDTLWCLEEAVLVERLQGCGAGTGH